MLKNPLCGKVCGKSTAAWASFYSLSLLLFVHHLISHTTTNLYPHPTINTTTLPHTHHRQYHATLNIEGPYHLPVTTPTPANGKSKNATNATKKPNGCVSNESKTCPCAKSETAVVHPHAGHGIFVH